MKKLQHKIHNYLDTLPNDSKEKIQYVEKIKKYKTECGCSLGAKFLFGSGLLYIAYIIFLNDNKSLSFFKAAIVGLLFIFFLSIVGKLLGIGIAKIKLKILYKSMDKKLNF